MLLFVYGTLRRDAANHHEMGDARFIGRARTAPRYELVDMGGYPAMLEGGRTSIVGELYEVDDALLRQLDAFEEVPEL
ncbi:MAG TPA: gamma-glutamylcyclotransferase family protein, partial [Polyangiales bacterium]|nr:gamma-glutamylcyclotransferase family protein [Polyangiales bacterium]